jgi:hypothetical protein
MRYRRAIRIVISILATTTVAVAAGFAEGAGHALWSIVLG